MHIVLITGLSGSGKSVALNTLEDTGHYCVDNLPSSLLSALVSTLAKSGTEMLAVAIDARSVDSLAELPKDIECLRGQGHTVHILFLTARTKTLLTRFSESRRSHPLTHRPQPGQGTHTPRTLLECLQAEDELLSAIKEISHVIDTSDLTANQLRSWIRNLVQTEPALLTLLFESFAFKVGVPLNADFVFDVRALPNPFYNQKLRPLTGQDTAVINFLDAQPEALEMTSDIYHFIEKWLPAFKQNNRSYLTIAIGCTGGQHRSVYISEHLASYFQASERVLVRHRELK